MDNAAARLYEVLTESKKFDPTTPCHTVWSAVLEVDSKLGLIGKLGKLLQQVEAASSTITEAHPDEVDSVNYWVSRIQNGFIEASLGAQWQNFSKHIDNHTLNYLKAHSKLLNFETPQSSLSKDTLDQIKTLALEAKERLIASDLETMIKLSLSKRISEIIESIEDYKITGFKEVFDTTNSLVGHITILPRDQKEKLRDSEAGKKIFEVVNRVSSAADAISKITELGQTIKQLLIGN